MAKMIQPGDKIRYILDCAGMKGKCAYVVCLLEATKFLVETETSIEYSRLDKVSTERWFGDRDIYNSKEKVASILSIYHDRITGRFCEMDLEDVELITEKTENPRNEVYLFPDIKDLK